ncbi:nicotinate-nucleotide-dimethylbenzimidazole phosphoribosyltransferase-like protein [Chytriomyces sp. MP71]|nr:nicotinate-nucleotide-dimethylbenzimidazole phosphoribosyltransferase-like protein [Chytriomyces sp. MP71]
MDAAATDSAWLIKAAAEMAAKTKPLSSLGALEHASLRLILLQRCLKPRLVSATVCLFAADHGIADSPVSHFPKVVTREMLRNLSTGGAAINAICNAHNLSLRITDVGVDTPEVFNGIITDKELSPNGTRSSLTSDSAMSNQQLDAAFQAGFTAAREVFSSSSDVSAIGIGELGIGNTAVASILLAAATGKSAEEVTGKGTGVEGDRYSLKVSIVAQVLEKHNHVIASSDWKLILQTMGGLEIAAMTATAVAVSRTPGKVLLVDGFISTVAFLYALLAFPDDARNLSRCAFLSHISAEQATQIAMEAVHKITDAFEGLAPLGRPLLDLGMRLGEGTGAALAFPILRAAAHIASDMNTFAGAGVSESKE